MISDLLALDGDYFNGDYVDPSQEVVRAYSNYKSAIFNRYLVLSKVMGVLLVCEAVTSKRRWEEAEALVEVSTQWSKLLGGATMFQYVGVNFPFSEYCRLSLRFVVNNLTHVDSIVDDRMKDDI